MGRKNTPDDPPVGGSGDDSADEPDRDQAGMDDFDEPASHSDSETTSPTDATPSNDGTGGGGGSAIPVTPTPDSADPEESDGESPNNEDESPVNDGDSEPNFERDRETPDEFERDVEHDVEDECDDEDDEDEEEDEPDVTIVQYMDPWSNMAWGVEPIMKRIEEVYGDNVEISYELAPVRDFTDPKGMMETWEYDADLHGMPVNTAVWEATPPESTELATRAYATAKEQSNRLARAYLRRLRIAAIVEGRNIEEKAVLFELAEDVGLDIDQFAADWDTVEIERGREVPDLPKTRTTIDDFTFVWNGYLDFKDFETYFLQIGLRQQPPRPLAEFVEEHGHVTVTEVREVYELGFNEAMTALKSEDGVEPVKIGETTFWTTFG